MLRKSCAPIYYNSIISIKFIIYFFWSLTYLSCKTRNVFCIYSEKCLLSTTFGATFTLKLFIMLRGVEVSWTIKNCVRDLSFERKIANNARLSCCCHDRTIMQVKMPNDTRFKIYICIYINTRVSRYSRRRRKRDRGFSGTDRHRSGER